jgi:hypothetical protein
MHIVGAIATTIDKANLDLALDVSKKILALGIVKHRCRSSPDILDRVTWIFDLGNDWGTQDNIFRPR